MATKYRLTWEVYKNGRKRWRKRYKKKTFVCEVKAGETKAQSYLRALSTFEEWKSKVDDTIHPVVAKFIVSWRNRLAEVEEKKRRISTDDSLESRHAYEVALMVEQVFKTLIISEEKGLSPEAAQALLDERIDGALPPAPWDLVRNDAPNSLKGVVRVYLEAREAEVNRNELTPIRLESIRRELERFSTELGENLPIDYLTASQLSKYKSICLDRVKEGRSKTTVRDQLQIVKQFLRWCYKQEIIEQLPRNIDDLTIATNNKPVEIFTNEEVSIWLDDAEERTRLYLLLMLNCGLTNKDIADLQQDEVNWSKGTITRRRSKTRHHGSTPVVCYQLWDMTFELLKKHRSKDKKLVLLNQLGNPLVSVQLKDGRQSRNDTIKLALKRLANKTKIKKAPKLLRKTAASKLGSHPEFSRFAQHFLGHSPSTVADRHYVKPDQASFDKAIAWLGKEFLG